MVNSNLCPALFLIDKNNCFHGVHSHITFMSHEERNSQVTRSRDSFFSWPRQRGRARGLGHSRPQSPSFLGHVVFTMKPRLGSGTENRFYVFEFIIFYQLTWITRRCLTQLQFNTFKRDEFLYCFVQTKVFCHRWFKPP